MATNKKQNHFDTTTLFTGFVALGSILLISLLADQAITANLIVENDPCRVVQCESPNRPAEIVGINPLTGNVKCKCPHHPEAYFEVSKVRKY